MVIFSLKSMYTFAIISSCAFYILKCTFKKIVVNQHIGSTLPKYLGFAKINTLQC